MAIVFDTQNSNDGGINTTNTYSITCASGAFLTTQAVFIQNPRPTGTATYAGVSMTSAVENIGASFERDIIFYLQNPTTGANNVITTTPGANRNYGGSISLLGVATSSPIGATNTATGTSSTPSISLTTTQANSWIIAILNIGAQPTVTVTGTNQTQRYQVDHVAGGLRANGTTQTTTTVGSYTSSWTLSASNAWTVTAIEVKELVSTRNNLLLLGVS